MLTNFFSNGTVLNTLRFVAGIVAVLVGTVVLNPDGSLGLAVWLLGAFVITHALCDRLLQHLKKNKSSAPRDSETGRREFAASFVVTAGVILGLLTVFDTRPFTQTIKVGVAALIVAILAGIVLVGLLLAAPTETDETDETAAENLIAYVFNLSVWALALGLLCIGAGLLHR